MYISDPNYGGSELKGAFVVGPSASQNTVEREIVIQLLNPHECKSGIRLTTFPSFRACIFSFSSILEPVHRSGGIRFSVAQ